MKKTLSIILAVLILLVSSTATYAADVKPENKITISLNTEDTATINYMDLEFSMKYKIYKGRLLLGNEGSEYNSMMTLLDVVSKIKENSRYDLSIKYSTQYSPTWGIQTVHSYVVVISEYKDDCLKTSLGFDVARAAEWTEESGYSCFDIYGEENFPVGMPHLLSYDGNAVYYLPARYIFEKLGFKVNYIDQEKKVEVYKE